MTYKEGKSGDHALEKVMDFLRAQQVDGLPVCRGSPVTLGLNAVPVQAHFTTETLSLLRRCTLHGTERTDARVFRVGLVASIGARSSRFGDRDTTRSPFRWMQVR